MEMATYATTSLLIGSLTTQRGQAPESETIEVLHPSPMAEQRAGGLGASL